jgi:hypothetical protein
MSILEKLCSRIKGIRVNVKISDGKPFNPCFQERTDAIKDLVKSHNKKEKDNGKHISKSG